VSAQRWQTAVVSLLVGVAVALALTIQVSYGGSAAKKRHQHSAHVHGTAKLDIAIEERTATVEFEAPAESIIGFEHKAKTAADQQKDRGQVDVPR
jgi:hypothetical protein